MPVRKVVNVPLSTDKGMCGGINTTIAKLAIACTKVDAEGVLLALFLREVAALQVYVVTPWSPLQTQRKRPGLCVLAPRAPIPSRG